MASRPRSPVRMRMQSSSGRTKILPSPICPVSGVRAAWTDHTAHGDEHSLRGPLGGRMIADSPDGWLLDFATAGG
jgi:hypothetical protein